jgi:septum formation protein
MKLPFIYLASASPRRHEILMRMDVAHQVLDIPAPDGEDEPRLPGEAPDAYVRRTAREKAIRAAQWLAKPAGSSTAQASCAATAGSGGSPILAADTTVILGECILGKPRDVDDARQMLGKLSGQTHAVHTAVAILYNGELREDESITQVRFKTLSDAEIRWYCASGEPMGKAGAYGIQGKAGLFIEHISGSYTGVMGLPVFETGRLLQSLFI